MTSLQKQIVTKLLLEDCTIADCRSSGYRLRSKDHDPVLKFYRSTFLSIKSILRKKAPSLYVIDKNKVRQLNGNTYTKRLYKNYLQNQDKN